MAIERTQLGGILRLGRARKRRWLTGAIACGLVLPWLEAASPRSGEGRGPDLDLQIIRTEGPGAGTPASPEPLPGPTSSSSPAPPRVASVSNRPVDPTRAHAPATHSSSKVKGAASTTDPIYLAKKTIADCQDRYRLVHDYTCKFVKRERIDGRLTAPHIMDMKARTNPKSLYFKFHQPNRGREAIYIQGRHNGRIVAHDVGLGKLFAGTMYLDPRGSMAMDENRHPVTEAGLGSLIDTIARHWSVELTPGESVVSLQADARAHNHPCTLIESVHPQRGPNFLFHKVKLYVDHQLGLPIRFEAYDWPKHPGATPELVEEYSYLDLKTNVGLRESDFDPANEQYSFGRF